MDIKDKNEVALFRYGVISDFITSNDSSLKPYSFFKEKLDGKTFFYGDKEVSVHPDTAVRWAKIYLTEGFDGLKPKGRVDLGKNRKIEDDVKEIIDYYIKEYPRLPATQIYELLLKNGDIAKGAFSLSTLTRYVSNARIDNKSKPEGKDRRRYEREHINEVWYGDTSVTIYINDGGVKKRVYVIALIDDASRFIVGLNAFYEDNFNNLMTVMKSAVSKYGKPKVFSFDNGSNYKCGQMRLLAGRIGSTVNYCKPYEPQSKAKLERFFRTMKDLFFSRVKSGDYKSLDDLRKDLDQFVQDYNLRIHSSLNGLCPLDRFFNESEYIIRLSEEEIEESFVLESERRVSQDCVIVIDGKQFEVHYRYCGQKLLIRYTPDLEKVYVVDKTSGELTPLKLLDTHSNATVKREKVKIATNKEEE